jgi:hypothetical protein
MLFKDEYGKISPFNKVIVESDIDVIMGLSMEDIAVSI